MMAALAVAQERPLSKADISVGYSLLNADLTRASSSLSSRQNMNGWYGSITGNFNKNVGMTAELSGQYKKVSGTGSVHLSSILAGPQISTTRGKWTCFGHGLFGFTHAGGDVQNDRSLAMAFGGGVQVRATKLISVRLGQLDYFHTNFKESGQNNLRFGAGIVLHLGQK